MNLDAPAQQPDAPAGQSWSGSVRRRDRRGAGGRDRALRIVWLLLLAGWVGSGVWHMNKTLPPGLHVASGWEILPADAIRPLIDLTTADAFGQPVVQQQIFDETLRVIADARRFVVLDQFLFNDHRGAASAATDGGPSTASLRPLSQELTEALLAAKRARPTLRILFITDPINDVYGGEPSAQLAALEAAGVEVVRTALDRLRDSNPAWSGLWRLTLAWWDGDAGGKGWLPHPLETGPARVTFRAWARLLNFKANHRKVLIADDGGERPGLVGIVGSANPHDASSGHSNLALEVRGEALRPLLDSELEIARFSGWRGAALPPVPVKAVPIPAAEAGPGGRAGAVRVQVLTEGAIRDGILERLAASGTGERIDVAMF